MLVPAAIPQINCFAFDPSASASSCQLSRAESRTDRLQPTSSFNQGFYPPTYYWAQSIFASSDPYLGSHIVRIANILMYVALLAVSWAIASPSVRRALFLVSGLLIAPLGLFIVASTNPSAWAYAALSVYWAVVLTYFDSTGTRRRTVGILLVLLAMIASGARADSSVWIVLTFLVLFVFRAVPHWDKKVDIPVGLGIGAVLAFSFASSNQGEIATGGLDTARSVSNVDLWFGNLGEIVRITLGPLGSSPLGWLDTPMYSVTSILATAIVVAVLFNFLVDHSRRENVAILMAVAIAILGPLYLLSQGRNLVGEVVQARYFFPWLPVAAGMIVLRTGSIRRGISISQASVVFVVLSVSHAYSLHQHMRRYISGLDVGGLNLETGKEWWWGRSAFVSPNVVWVTVSLLYSLALFGVLFGYCARPTDDDDDPEPAPPPDDASVLDGHPGAVTQNVSSRSL